VGVWPHRLEAHLVACARELSQSWLGGLVAVGSPPATQPASTVPRRKTASTAKNDLVAIALEARAFSRWGDEISMKFLDFYFVVGFFVVELPSIQSSTSKLASKQASLLIRASFHRIKVKREMKE
jgi:hypothetical protein